MVRYALFPCFFIVAVLFSSCASTPLKQAGIQGESTLSAVRTLTKAYERRDLEGFMETVSSAYRDRDGLQASVAKVFAAYQTIRFKVQETRMLITVQQQGPIKAVFTWEGEWQTKGGRIVKDGARVTLLFDPGVYKLLGIEGKNPFVPSETPLPARQQ